MTAQKFHCGKCGFTKTYDVKVESDTGYAVGYPEECPKCGDPDIEAVEFGPEDIPDELDLHDRLMKAGMSEPKAAIEAHKIVERAKRHFGLK